MTTRIQEFDYSINLLRALLWQDNAAPKTTSLLQQKQAWYDENVSTFWQNWVTDVFDIRTANEFGLAVWAIILGIPTSAILPPTTKLNFGFGLPLLTQDANDARGTWTAANGPTITAGQLDPNAGTNAVKLDLSTGTGSARTVLVPTTTGGIPAGVTTIQFQAKLISGTQGTLTSSIGGASSAAWPALTSAWQTVTLTVTNPTAGTTAFDLIAPSASAAVVGVFGLKVCSGSSVYNHNLNFDRGNFGAASSSVVGLTLEQKRILLRLRYFKLISRCTVPEINRMMKSVLGDQGSVYVLDANDMSFVTYVFGFQPNSALAFVLQNFDVLPRPAAVGVRYIVGSRATFGFGPYFKNFNHGTFGA